MSMRGSGGGFVRDGATQTGRAVILIVVAIVVAVILLHHNGSTTAQTVANTTTSTVATTVAHPTTTATTEPPTTEPPVTVPAASVKVLVLNGSDFNQPFASQTADKVHQLGYTTLTPNNAASIVKHSSIFVVTHGFAPEGKALADKLGLPESAVKTTVPSGPPLSSAIPASGADLVLVVGPDLAPGTGSGSSQSSQSTTTH